MYNQAIILGVLVSLIYTEITGFSAGLIIPGYLALNLHSPVRLAYTLLVALAALGLCQLLARVVILYGRRRFAVLILLTFLIGAAAGWLNIVPVSVVGVVLPGLIAREFDRQGVLNTLLSMAVTTGFTALCLLLLGRGLLI